MGPGGFRVPAATNLEGEDQARAREALANSGYVFSLAQRACCKVALRGPNSVSRSTARGLCSSQGADKSGVDSKLQSASPAPQKQARVKVEVPDYPKFCFCGLMFLALDALLAETGPDETVIT